MRAAFAAIILALAGLVGPLVSVPLGTAGPAAAASTCGSGVLVVVDLRHFGGSLTRGCATSLGSGLDDLHAAGYTTTGTVHDGDGFVCRIDGYPTPSQDPCFNTPPATAYWSYWHADAGASSWSYSRSGAASTHPGAGSVNAWVFGGTNTSGTSGGPSFSPAEARGSGSVSGSGGSNPGGSGSGGSGSGRAGSGATTQRPGSGSHAPGGPRSTSERRGGSAHPSSTSGSSASARSSSEASASRAAASSSSSSATSGAPATSGGSSGTTSGPAFADASAVGHRSSSSGSPLPLVLTGVLVLLLGGAAAVVGMRRRAGRA